MKELTQNQKEVLQKLRDQGAEFIAAATERHWLAGEAYYIDDRVNVKGIRRKFKQGNKEALEGAK